MIYHFLNCLKCRDHPKGGTRASCAIDSLIEIFYFCLYKNNSAITEDEESLPLTYKLLTISQYRELNNKVFCGVREPLWNFLVAKLPEHYAPIGRGDAQAFAGFAMMISELAEFFQLGVNGDVYCTLCMNKLDALPTHTEPLTLSRECVLKAKKCFQRSVEILIEVIIGNHTHTRCIDCECQLRILNASLYLPKYMIVEVPVHNSVNVIDIVIPELSVIFGNIYQVTGVVMKQHGHFYVIVKKPGNCGYILIDDMKNQIFHYPTISAAVTRNKERVSKFHTTSMDTDAVWLVLLEHVSGNRQSPVNYFCTNRGKTIAKVATSSDGTTHVTSTKPTRATHSQLLLSSSMQASTVTVAKPQAGASVKSSTPTRNKHSQSSSSSMQASTVTVARPYPGVSVKSSTPTRSKHPQSSASSMQASTVTVAGPHPGVSVKSSTPSRSKHPQSSASSMQASTVTVAGPQAGVLSSTPAHNKHRQSSSSSLQASTVTVARPHRGVSIKSSTPTRSKHPQSSVSSVQASTVTVTRPHPGVLIKSSTPTHSKHPQSSASSMQASTVTVPGPYPGVSVKSSTPTRSKHSQSPLASSMQTSLVTLTMPTSPVVTNPSGLPTMIASPNQQQSQSSPIKIRSPSGRWNVCDTPMNKKRVQPSPNSGWKVSTPSKTSVNNEDVTYIENPDGKIYLLCKDLWHVSGLEKSVANRGYTKIDKLLVQEGMEKEDVFLFSSKKRTHIRLDAALIICQKWRGTGTWKRENEGKLTATKECLTKLAQERRAPRKMLNFDGNSPRAKVKPASIKSNPCKVKHPVRSLRKLINTLYNLNFRCDRLALMECLSGLFRPGHKKQFCGYISKKDIQDILSSVPPSNTKSGGKAKNLLEELAIETFETSLQMSADDLIDLVENFTGYRLAQQLKKLLPGIPGRSDHVAAQKLYYRQCDAVLLPRRTPTGFEISISRLIEVLQFRYHWLASPIHWKVYGDGREIGGKQSTFVAISPMNNEMALKGVRFQSPKHVYHTNIFFESDSRDNLEENLGYPVSRLDREIGLLQEHGRHTFTLAADYMFLIAILDGDGTLGPTSDKGWSIYKDSDKVQKREVSVDTGFRTDLKGQIDRCHASSLLPSIPLQRTVFCLLHATARSVEHLLSFVVEDICAEANRLKQQKMGTFGDVDSYRANKIQTLENNINKLGVRQGRFHFHFEQNGNLKQVKLNKDHAYVIISPDSTGITSYPPALKNVLSETVTVSNTKPAAVKKMLSLKDKYSVFELVCTIWSHFYQMVTILREDQWILKEGCSVTSTNPDDYEWGYSADKCSEYKGHAESFYQLFTLQYRVEKLTPYMMILIDQAPKFMESLPFPIARYTSESGEHKNYDDNRYTYQHTTRGGGSNRDDTILALFRHSWKTLSHSIMEGDTADKFEAYVREHVAALRIQQAYRKWIVCKKLKCHPQWTSPKSISLTLDDNVKKEKQNKNKEVLNDLGLRFGSNESKTDSKILRNKVFVLCGSVPKTANGRMKQEDVAKIIIENGGRVRKTLPASQKRISTKRYIVLSNEVFVGKQRKVHLALKLAIAGGHPILRYEFVFDSIKYNDEKEQHDYALDVSCLASTITKHVPLHRQHFYRSAGTFAGHVKRQRMLARRSVAHIVRKQKKNRGKRRKPARTACMYYALQQTKIMDAKSFKDQSKWMGFFMKKWKRLTAEEKAKYDLQWKKEKMAENQ